MIDGKAQSPQTNGICDALPQDDPERVLPDLDAWISSYNHERTHQGKICCGRTPMATFEDGKRICPEKPIS